MSSLPYAAIGLLLGGLVNLISDSLPTRGRLALPHCHACGGPRHKAGWLAITAWLTRTTECEYCRTPLRRRHLFVELAAAGLAVWLHLNRLGPSGYLPALAITMLFLLITVIDVEHRLILHAVSLPSILLLTLYGVLSPTSGPMKTLLGGAAGFAFVMVLYLFGGLFGRWIARRRGEDLEEVAFGFGDVTLATLIGVVVGWPGIILALMVGVLAAGAFSLIYILAAVALGRYQPYMPIPYGPFLILGGLLVYLGGRDVFMVLLGG